MSSRRSLRRWTAQWAAASSSLAHRPDTRVEPWASGPPLRGLADKIVAALATVADQEQDEETSGRLRRLVSWFGAGGRDVLVEVAANVVTRGVGMWPMADVSAWGLALSPVLSGAVGAGQRSLRRSCPRMRKRHTGSVSDPLSGKERA